MHGTYDGASLIRPRMYGSSDRYKVRSKSWPAAGAGTAFSARRKLPGVGTPTGREFNTMLRFMVVVMILASLK
jgi:hypothetical protein